MNRNVCRLALVALVTAMASLSPVLAATINVTANVTLSETWTNDNEYILTKPIYVSNGATLTIERGATVRGEPQSIPGANDPGALIITRGSKIRALGTNLQPIVFTDLNDDNIGSDPGTPPYDNFANALGTTAQWGGLVVLGRGWVANNTLAAPDATREVQIEGLDPAGGLGLYGNCAAVHGNPPNPLRICDDDDSGTINYLSIRYGGFNLSANNEINGLTLGAVGRATDIDYVEVLNEKDDFIEFFGGAAQVEHFIGMNGGDDGVDFDEGWRGKMQFVFIVQGTPGTDKNDKGGEWDGGNNPDGSQPLTIPTIYNGTWIGLGAAKTTYTDRIRNTAFHMRDNGAVRLYNSAALDFGGATMIVEGTSTSCQGAASSGERSITAYVADGNYLIEEVSDNQLEFKNDTFWCFGNTSSIPTGACTVTSAPCCSNADCGVNTCVDTAPTYGGDTGKIHRDIAAFSNAALNNSYVACASALPIRNLTRTDSGSATTPDPIISLDPRPTTGGVLLTGLTRTAPADGFFEAAPYRGAFGTSNWAAGWSTMARLGYFPPKAQIQVTTNIASSTTWTADNEYILTKPIYVTTGATLTIEAGTTVRGEPQSIPGANDPGTLIITRGSKIQALGTADNPIVFTDLNDDNIGNSPGTPPYDNFANALGTTAQWGGVVLLGRGWVANNTLAAPDATREVQIEGLDPAGGLGLYGNCAAVHGNPPNPLRICDDDDSGTINYLSIRYGGFNLSANNEINGLTLGAVGRATDIDYVEVLNEKDDFIEFFGGAAQVKHFIGMNGGDDGVDFDEGWRGKMQFVFIVQGTPGTDKNDKGGEWDGGNNPDGSQPLTIPTIYNGTWIGLGAAKTTYTDRIRNTAFHMRDNGAVRLYNSAALDFGGATMIVEGTSTSCQGAASSGERSITAYVADGNYLIEEVSDNQLEFKNDTFWCFGNTSSIPTGACTVTSAPCCSNADCGVNTCVDTAPTYGGDTGKIHRDIAAFSNAALNNSYVACASALPIRTLTRTSSGSSTTPDPIIALDPRPTTGSVLLTGPTRTPPADGFFQPAPYRGAFAGGDNWAAGWSTMDRIGYVAKCDLVNSPNAVPNEAQKLRFLNKTTMGWNPPQGDDVEVYDVVRSTDKTNFTTATCVETNDFDTSAVDATTPSVGQVFYYLVRAGNDCGEGTLGYRSTGVERAGGSCP